MTLEIVLVVGLMLVLVEAVFHWRARKAIFKSCDIFQEMTGKKHPLDF